MNIVPKRQDCRALTFVELLVVISVLVVLALLMLPMLGSRGCCKAIRINCVNNLKQVGLCFRIWSGDNGDHYPMFYGTNMSGAVIRPNATNVFYYFQIMSNEFTTPKAVVCPGDERRFSTESFGTNFNNQNVSYFVGLDADETQPLMILAGDRNMTDKLPLDNGVMNASTNHPPVWTKEMHDGQGNIALNDGSVLQLNTATLRKAVGKTGVITNRLLMP